MAVAIDFFYTGSLLAPGIITGALRTSDSRFVLVWKWIVPELVCAWTARFYLAYLADGTLSALSP